jgi:hypothetical protein
MHNSSLRNAEFEETFTETNRRWFLGMEDGEEKERLLSLNSQQLTDVRGRLKALRDEKANQSK